MATTNTNLQSNMPSQRIRIGIGLSKKRLNDLIAKVQEFETETKVKKYGTADLYDEIMEVTDLAISLTDEIKRMKKLDAEWTLLIQNNPAEELVQQDYIKRLGDYHFVLSKAEITISELRKRHDLVLKLHKNQSTEECDYPNFDTYDFLDKRSTTPTANVNPASHNAMELQQTPNVNAPIAIATTTSPPHLNVKLPDIHLPKFSGNFIEFLHYFELFSSMIDTQPIDTTVKFYYLKASLEGEALALIEHLPTNSMNYQIAKDLLMKNYGDTTRIRHFLLRELQDLPTVNNHNNVSQLHHLWTNASRHFHQLCKLQPEADNNILADIIMRKLPKKIISQVMNKYPSLQTLKASQLLEMIHNFVQTETLLITIFDQQNHPNTDRKITTMSTNSQQRTKSNPHRQHNSNAPHQHHQQSKPNTNSKSFSPCIFCSVVDNQHRYEDCPTHNTGEQRAKRARELKLCFKCLKSDHETRSCSRTLSCKHCSKDNHHHVLCFKHHSSRQNNTSNANQATRNYSQNNSSLQQRQNFNARSSQNQHRNTHLNITSPNPIIDDDETTSDNVVLAINSRPTSKSTHAQHALPPTMMGTSNNITSLPNITDESIPIQPKPMSKEIAMMATKLPVIDFNQEPRQAVLMLDSGSNQSYISSNFANQLGLQAEKKQELNVHTFGSKKKKRISANQYQINIQVKEEIVPIQVTEIPLITNSIHMIPIDPSAIDSPTIKSILNNINGYLPREEMCPDLLIGLDFMNSILGSTTSTTLPNGLTLHDTKCGLILSGKEDETAAEILLDLDQHKSICYHQLSTPVPIDANDSVLPSENKSLTELLERFWTIENSMSESMLSTDEKIAAEFYHKSTYRNPDGRYVIRWPIKDDQEKLELPDNHHLAYHRLQHLLKRLNSNPDNYRQYDDIIKDQLEKQFIEVVENKDMSDGDTIHYISHHAVYKQSSKSTKVRIVFDASARANKQSKSLNDILHTGESLLPMIPAIISRVRHDPILISSDLEKAFLQLELDIRDRDLCRFIWQHPNQSKPTIYRFRRMPFGIKTSPYLLNKTITMHLTENPSEVNNKMLKNCYVDNIFFGVNNPEEGKKFFNESRKTFHDAQMNLTQFVSNCPQLNQFFNDQLGEDITSQDQKILGIPWNIDDDTFNLNSIQPINNVITKRKVLSTIASIYDPLGFLTPTTLLGKLFFQQLWKETKNWDQTLQPQEIAEWRSIEKKLVGHPIKIRRRYFSTPTLINATVELHIFSDASEHAYGAVAYLRRTQNNQIDTAFIQSKSRVSPANRQLTIPMLELLGIQQAAIMCSKIKTTIGIKISKTFIWTDSLAMVDSIWNNKASTLFARNRLRTIKMYAPDSTFSHVPGKLNPADLLTRGCTFDELRDNQKWWNGPSFLLQKTLPIRESSLTEVTTNLSIDQEPTHQILDPKRYSSFRRLLHIMIYILKFICRNDSEDQLRNKAKTKLLFLAQQIDPPDDDTIRHLNLYQENNIWYFKGRLPSAKLAFLPRGHIAKLFVMEIHRNNNHSSTIFTLSQVRNEVWIPRGLSFVKKTLKSCSHCCIRKAIPCHQPDFPNYPDARTTWSSPFSKCGFDYLGPLQMKTDGNVTKCWVILFTCLQTRYTSVQMAKSLSSEHLLNALRRFTATYGIPDTIYTDNAAQIKLLRNVIEEVRGQQEKNRISSINLPTFKFCPAHSPWTGGIYERMVGIFKHCLQKTNTTKSLLDEDGLLTILAEAESIINDRPITFTSSENNDPSPIRPCDLVFPNKKRNHLLTVPEYMDTTDLLDNNAKLLENWMRLSSLTQHFQDRWRNEYLQILQSRTQTKHKQKKINWNQELKTGQIVLIEDDTDKAKWDLGKIIEVSNRSAKLKNARTNRTIERPNKFLYPIEVTPMDSNDETEILATTPDEERRQPTISETQNQPLRRSARFANISTSLLIVTTLLCLINTTQATDIDATNSSTTPIIDTSSPSATTASFLTTTINEIQKTVQQLKITVFIFGLVIMISSLINFATATLRLVHFIFNIFRIIFKCICTTCQSCFCKLRDNRPRRGTILMIILIWLHITSTTTESCDDTAHLSAPDNVCYTQDDQTTCTINTVSLVNVRANGTTTCLDIRTPNTTIMKLKIKAQSIINVCNKQILFFSRDFQLSYEYSHRCADAGSCVGNTCNNIDDEHNLPELSSHAKQSPGYTRCTASCGCITCNGCFYCSPSCLFYRYFAEPTSTTIYEISNCPSWTTKIRVVITIDEKETEIDLSPGLKQQVPETNISITATSLHSPPSNLHSNNFILAFSPSELNPIWIASTSTPVVSHGTPIRGTLGELICSTKQEIV